MGLPYCVQEGTETIISVFFLPYGITYKHSNSI